MAETRQMIRGKSSYHREYDKGIIKANTSDQPQPSVDSQDRASTREDCEGEYYSNQGIVFLRDEDISDIHRGSDSVGWLAGESGDEELSFAIGALKIRIRFLGKRW